MAVSKTKELFLKASRNLFERQGFSGTGLKQIVSSAGAPWGSLYHFFPGGKEELAVSVVQFAGHEDDRAFRENFEQAEDLPTAISNIFRYEMRHLKKSNYAEGCAVASVASDVTTISEPIRIACSDVFSQWEDTIASAFEEQRIGRKEAGEVAGFIISVLEGATLLCRTKRSTDPMKDALKNVDIVVRNLLAQ